MILTFHTFWCNKKPSASPRVFYCTKMCEKSKSTTFWYYERFRCLESHTRSAFDCPDLCYNAMSLRNWQNTFFVAVACRRCTQTLTHHPDASLIWDEQLMKSPPCSGYQWGDKTLDMTSVYIHSDAACRPDPEYSRLFYPQNSPPALSIVRNASHARKTDFSHEKTCCIMDPWLITGGVAGSEPTNLVFCRYFERRSFSINPAKNRRGGGEGPSAAVSLLARLRESYGLSKWTQYHMICLFQWQ